MIFGQRLKQLREEKGLKQAEIATKLGISMQSISAYESVREPSYNVLSKLADEFDVTADYLIGRSSLRISTEIATKLPIMEELKNNLVKCAAMGKTNFINELNKLIGENLNNLKTAQVELDASLLNNLTAILKILNDFIDEVGPLKLSEMPDLSKHPNREKATNILYSAADKMRSIYFKWGNRIIETYCNKENPS
jgi:transcriptional regulator with XRE-family HTH domain